MKKLLLFFATNILSLNASLSLISCNNKEKVKNPSIISDERDNERDNEKDNERDNEKDKDKDNDKDNDKDKDKDKDNIKQFDLSNLNLEPINIERHQSKTIIEFDIKEQIKNDFRLKDIDTDELKIEFPKDFDTDKIANYSVKILAIDNAKSVKNHYDLKINIVSASQIIKISLVLKDTTILANYGDNKIYHFNADWTKVSEDPLIDNIEGGPIEKMIELKSAKILIGTAGGVISQYDFQSKILTKLSKIAVVITSMIQLDDDTILISGAGYKDKKRFAIIYSFDSITSIAPVEKKVIENKKIDSLLQLPDKTIQISCSDGTILILKADNTLSEGNGTNQNN